MINFGIIENNFKPDNKGKCSEANAGMISTASPQATEAGARILHEGGNAVDAAVASAFALSVAEPQASGLGGQTMMLINIGKKMLAIDGSSRAPSLAHVNAIDINDRSVGYRATTVPGTPATLAFVHRKYGKLRWESVLEPAIEIAENGYPVSELQHKLQVREEQNFKKVPSRSGMKYFYKNGEAYKIGDVFKQPEMAALLKKIRDKGIEEFYSGTVAKRIDADMRENGGLLRYDDLCLLPWPVVRFPVMKKYRGLNIHSMPAPGAGRPLLFVLNMLNRIPKDYEADNQDKRNLLLIHILRKALLERSGKPFHPIFSSYVDHDVDMLNDQYADEVVAGILRKVDEMLLPSIPTEDEVSGETTHLSVIDKDGIAVSLTQSIERVYGSKAAADGLGFLYNNYLFDFDYEQPHHPFYLRPNHVPWATVSPTLVQNGDQIWIALGSPGSERILSTLTLFLNRITDFDYSICEAMKAPRLHCSLGGKISLEAGRFDESFIEYLSEKGYRIDRQDPYAFYLGSIHAVLKRSDGKGFQGIADVRRDGIALGINE